MVGCFNKRRVLASSLPAGPVGHVALHLKAAPAGEPDKDLLLSVAATISQAARNIEKL
jgi:hypothetical protein